MNPITKNDNILILVIVLCFSFLFWGFAATDNDTLKTTILTAIISTLMTVVNWRYGSSKSSANKDETIKALQEDKTVIKSETVNADNVETVNTHTVNQQS